MDKVTLKNPLTFRLDEHNKLLAVNEPVVNKVALDEVAIREMLAEQGLSDLFLDEKALSRLVQTYSNSNADFILEIGELRNGEFIITVSDDKMTGWLTMTPAYGGDYVTFEQIRQSLKEKGIVNGLISRTEIEAVLKKGQAMDYLIAQGQASVSGLDAQFHSLIVEMQERRPQVNEYGIVDFRELGQLLMVNQGDPLMRRILPTEGQKGKNILGQILMPKPSKDTPFTSELTGAVFDPDDCNLLVSSIIGQPLLIPNGVIVSPTITVPQVDISTGNLSFDGTINILGDVMEGMKVYALNDIFIGGTVEAAEIEAGGNVSIKGGVVGNISSSATSIPGKISSKGSISARFATNVIIEADINIVIEEYSVNNQLTALNQILIGKPGKKGLIVGGSARALMQIQAVSVGSSSGIKTYLQTGLNPNTQEQLNIIERHIKSNEKNQEDIKKAIYFLENNPEKDKNGLLDKARCALKILVGEIAQHYADQKRLHAEMSFFEYTKIVVDQAIYNGVEIQIGDQIWKAKEKRSKTVFRLIDGKISLGR